MDCRTLAFVTFLYVTQGMVKGQSIPVQYEIVYPYGYMYPKRNVAVNYNWGENSNVGTHAAYRHESQGPSSEMAEGKLLILDFMTKKFTEKAKMKEKAAMEMGSRAKHHEQYSQIYGNLSREYEEKAKEEKASSENELKKAQSHEKESSELSTKAKDIVKQAWKQEDEEVGFVNNYRKGYWEANVANVKAVSAIAQKRIRELQAKRALARANELEKLANLLLSEAQEYELMAKAALENARKEKAIADIKAEIAKQHHAKAEDYFLNRVTKYKARSKDSFTKYLEYLLKAEKEQELAREEQLKAAYEIKLANAYIQKSQQHSAFANIAHSRLNEDMAKAKESKSGLFKSREPKILLSSRMVEEKSVKVIS